MRFGELGFSLMFVLVCGLHGFMILRDWGHRVLLPTASNSSTLSLWKFPFPGSRVVTALGV